MIASFTAAFSRPDRRRRWSTLRKSSPSAPWRRSVSGFLCAAALCCGACGVGTGRDTAPKAQVFEAQAIAPALAFRLAYWTDFHSLTPEKILPIARNKNKLSRACNASLRELRAKLFEEREEQAERKGENLKTVTVAELSTLKQNQLAFLESLCLSFKQGATGIKKAGVARYHPIAYLDKITSNSESGIGTVTERSFRPAFAVEAAQAIITKLREKTEGAGTTSETSVVDEQAPDTSGVDWNATQAWLREELAKGSSVAAVLAALPTAFATFQSVASELPKLLDEAEVQTIKTKAIKATESDGNAYSMYWLSTTPGSLASPASSSSASSGSASAAASPADGSRAVVGAEPAVLGPEAAAEAGDALPMLGRNPRAHHVERALDLVLSCAELAQSAPQLLGLEGKTSGKVCDFTARRKELEHAQNYRQNVALGPLGTVERAYRVRLYFRNGIRLRLFGILAGATSLQRECADGTTGSASAPPLRSIDGIYTHPSLEHVARTAVEQSNNDLFTRTLPSVREFAVLDRTHPASGPRRFVAIPLRSRSNVKVALESSAQEEFRSRYNAL